MSATMPGSELEQGGAAVPPVKTRRYQDERRINLFSLVPIALLIFLIATIVVINPGLATPGTIETKSNAAVTLALVATGQTFAILTGGI